MKVLPVFTWSLLLHQRKRVDTHYFPHFYSWIFFVANSINILISLFYFSFLFFYLIILFICFHYLENIVFSKNKRMILTRHCLPWLTTCVLGLRHVKETCCKNMMVYSSMKGVFNICLYILILYVNKTDSIQTKSMSFTYWTVVSIFTMCCSFILWCLDECIVTSSIWDYCLIKL